VVLRVAELFLLMTLSFSNRWCARIPRVVQQVEALDSWTSDMLAQLCRGMMWPHIAADRFPRSIRANAARAFCLNSKQRCIKKGLELKVVTPRSIEGEEHAEKAWDNRFSWTYLAYSGTIEVEHLVYVRH
jgi:hypothetical protein